MFDGESEGIPLGSEEGGMEGCSLGTILGSSVGKGIVGSKEGNWDEPTEGLRLGVEDNLGVG